MKKIFLFPLVFILCLSACKYDAIKDTDPLSAQLKLRETTYNIAPSISVSLDSVLNDSRCPSNVECVWEGNAEARFIFEDRGGKVKFTLNTNTGFKTEAV